MMSYKEKARVYWCQQNDGVQLLKHLKIIASQLEKNDTRKLSRFAYEKENHTQSWNDRS